MNTFFYTQLKSGGHDAVKRWTRHLIRGTLNPSRIYDADDTNTVVLIPVNHAESHWYLMGK